jgi:hypothetical protein
MADDIRVFEVHTTFVDFEQESASVKWYFKANVGTDGLGAPLATVASIDTWVASQVALMTALTNANHSEYYWGFRKFYTRSGPTGPGSEKWPNAEDKAYFVFATAEGDTVTLSIPAPIDASMSVDDMETVSRSQADVTAFVTAWITASGDAGDGIHCDKDGQHIQECDYAYRRRSKSRSERPGRSKAIG